MLRSVTMCLARINLQFFEHRTSQGILGQHALHRMLDNSFGMILTQLRKIGRLEATYVTRMMVIHLVVFLVPGNPNLLRVDDDDVITGIDMRGVLGFVLAA